MEKPIVPTCKAMKLNTPLTPPKNKVKDDDFKFISRVKKILEKTGEESQSELVVCELLLKIESMELSLETLEATMIGRTVNALKKHHASEEVRKIATILVKQWKGTAVKEWSKKQSNNIVESTTSLSQQVKPTEVINRMMKNMEIRNKVEGNVMMDSFGKKEARKRKLVEQEQGFEFDHLQELENLMKKQRIEDERERSRINIHQHNRRMFVLLPHGLDPALLLVN